MRTRLAPTPSGYLHVGNLVNFALVDIVAREKSAEVVLRIDDIDAPRVRDEYVADIFRVVDWLGIDYTHGPASVEDAATWSQRTRMAHYQAALDLLRGDESATYVCECSRTSLTAKPCECPERDLELVTGRTTLRLRLHDADDPVVWRRDGLPAYHLASVIDDHVLGITLVVRGEDLRSATTVQRYMSSLLPDNTFADALVVHHPVICGADGVKLSKSAGSGSRPLDLTEELRAQVVGHASSYADALIR